MVVVNIYIRVLQLQLPVNSTDQVPANAQLNQIKNLSEYAFIVPRTNRSRDGSRSEPPAPFISSGSSSSEARNRSEPQGGPSPRTDRSRDWWTGRADRSMHPERAQTLAMDRETGGEGWELYRRRSWQRRRSHDEGSPRLSGSVPPRDGPPWPLPPRLKSTPHAAFRKLLDGACIFI